MPKEIKSEGPKDAKIALIGEAPGATEEARGLPFQGSAGRELNICLSKAGINRSLCYLDNVILERPPNNDISKFIDLSKKNPVLTEAYKEYELRLLDRLSNIRPNIVVALGAVPLFALTGLKGITKWRGSILSSKTLSSEEPLKLIPCIHPAAALRQYIYRHYIVHDLKRALAQSAIPDIRRTKREIVFLTGYEDCMWELEGVLASSEVAVDIEVMQDEVSCISFATSMHHSVCIPFRAGGRNNWNTEEETDIWYDIARIMQDPRIKKIGQNLIFDTGFLFKRYGINTVNIEDTMVGMGVAYADYPKGLDFITSIYCDGEPYYKDEGKMYFKFGGSDEEFWHYNAMDSAVCIEAFPKIMTDLKALGNTKTYEEQRKLIGPLTYMQERGVRIDVDSLEKAKEDASVELERLELELHEMCGRKINPRSVKDLKGYFYIEKNIKPYISRSTGNPTVDETALKRIARKGYKEAQHLLKIRKLTKMKGTYLDVTLDDDRRLRCAYNPVGTKSGRLSSSKTIFGTGTNMQNLPDEFRRYILPDEGYLLYNIDLSQAENRIVAYVAPESRMIKAFEQGQDVHSLTASLIFGDTPTEIKKWDEEDVKCEIGGGEFTKRFWGKKANHAFNYGLGYKKFSLYYEISEAEAKFIREKYYLNYPGVNMYQQWVRNSLGNDLTLTNCFGRKKLFMDRWGDELFKEGYSFIPQSTVADMVNRWGLNYIYYNQDLFKPVELLMQIHDSIVFQISKEYPLDIHVRCIWKMIESFQQPVQWKGGSFVIPADLDIGPNFKDRTKVKGYSDEEGLLRRLKYFLEKEGLYNGKN